MKEIVVVSGKGGTGKTSLLASFALLAEEPVVADCDVDAADLHLILEPIVRKTHDFISGYEAEVMPDLCDSCGACLNLCRFDAIRGDGGPFVIDPHGCEGCGTCAAFCPRDAVALRERHCGVWMVSETRAGPMAHARLGIAAENSGKLVSTVRREARRLASERKRDLILIDGPPGTGCPVIASIGGASLVLVVTEPTVSGEHDLRRILELARHFRVPACVTVNKWDISPAMTNRIERGARTMGADVLGRVRYDKGFTRAQIDACAVVETDAVSAGDVRRVWFQLLDLVGEKS
ncbi:MAG: (4Fe-4S)-binding protein [Alphaproteobacteria bacterium]|nr:(4Fe-4S)-binding protein [Alphaproteobacteria bacterium]